MNNTSNQFIQNFKKDQIIFLAGQLENTLYYIRSGRVMICVLKGSQVTPLSYLEEGQFLGELSFFDDQPRSATVIATKETSLFAIPFSEKEKQFPDWLLKLGQSLTKKIRHNDELIRKHGLRKKHVESIRPLNIEEQTYYYQLIKKYQNENDA